MVAGSGTRAAAPAASVACELPAGARALRLGVSGAELWRGRPPSRPSPASGGARAAGGCDAAGARPEPKPGRAPSSAFSDSSALIAGAAVVFPALALDAPEVLSCAACSLGHGASKELFAAVVKGSDLLLGALAMGFAKVLTVLVTSWVLAAVVS